MPEKEGAPELWAICVDGKKIGGLMPYGAKLKAEKKRLRQLAGIEVRRATEAEILDSGLADLYVNK